MKNKPIRIASMRNPVRNAVLILLFIGIVFFLIFNLKFFIKNRASLGEQPARIVQPIKIVFASPTVNRTRTGYTYMRNSFDAIQKVFSKFIDFEYYAFSHSDFGEILSHPRFIHKTHAPYSLPVKFTPRTKKESKILQQSLDWIKMMRSMKRNCPKDGIFMIMEDDFRVCPHSLWHFLTILKWAANNKQFWSAVRMSIGLNGILFQCRDVDDLLKVVEAKCLNDPIPVDMVVPQWWNSINGLSVGKGRSLYTYRWNLFEHMGEETTIGHDPNPRRFPKCFSLLHMQFFLQ
jgi:hypothetical protein